MNDYLLHLINVYKLKVNRILHIGANDGSEINNYVENGFNNGVFIEGDESLIPQLENNIIKYPGWAAIKAMLSNEKKQSVNFWKANNQGYSSSILKPAQHLVEHPNVLFNEIVKVETITLDSLNLGNFDLIVMDIQGAELLAMQGGIETVKNAKYIWLEVTTGNLYDGDSSITEIIKFLDQYGFVLIYTQIGINLWGDALFVSKNILSNLGK